MAEVNFEIKGELKRGSMYLIQAKVKFSPEDLQKAALNFDMLGQRLGVKFILVTHDFELIDAQSLFKSEGFRERIRSVIREEFKSTFKGSSSK